MDRFGRIWEERFGGARRNVIGAHTYGYNHLSFAMSAIGDVQTTGPSRPVRRAYGRLMPGRSRRTECGPAALPADPRHPPHRRADAAT